jgi:hypothetical protein
LVHALGNRFVHHKVKNGAIITKLQEPTRVRSWRPPCEATVVAYRCDVRKSVLILAKPPGQSKRLSGTIGSRKPVNPP